MIGIETIVENEVWLQALPDPEGFAARIFEAARAREPSLAGEVALLLTGDDALRDLNRRFRGKDAATNVLSFPAQGDEAFLGNIALAFDICAREAREKGVAFAAHAAHLIVHGLLHLVGYDHENEGEAESMERLETEILASLGVASPYAVEERAC